MCTRFERACSKPLSDASIDLAPGSSKQTALYAAAPLQPLSIAAHQLQIPIQLLGTDVDEHQLRRAGDACYSLGSLKDLPAEWLDRAFEARGSKFCLRPEFGEHVEFRKQDIRREMPHGPFHLILCRYLAFTYFDQDVQRRVATQLYDRVATGGMVVLGKHESWPTEAPRITEMKQGLRIYRAEKRSK